MAHQQYRLGVDVGGTHTDMVLFDAADNSIVIAKLPSTPQNPAIAVLDGVNRFIADGIAPDEILVGDHVFLEAAIAQSLRKRHGELRARLGDRLVKRCEKILGYPRVDFHPGLATILFFRTPLQRCRY